MRIRSAAAASLVVVSLAARAGASPGCGEWTPGLFPRRGVDGLVLALATHDDGSGLALFAGGSFAQAGGAAVSNVGRWNGTAWSPLGRGTNGEVDALATFDDGAGVALFAGGAFTAAGDHDAAHVARWDGQAWSPLGAGVDGGVRALAVFDDGSGAALYAAGDFANAGGLPASHVARWDGNRWTAVGDGLDGAVRALAVFDDGTGPALFAGGDFTTGAGGALGHIAKLDAGRWAPLGQGTSRAVRAFVVHDDGGGTGPALYAAGDLDSAGGVSVDAVARWDGAAWSALGSDLDRLKAVSVLAVFDDGSLSSTGRSGPSLFAGAFGGYWSDQARIARWNGSAWTSIGGPGVAGDATAMAAFGSELFVAGPYFVAGLFTDGIARWNGSTWSLVTSGFTGGVDALAVHDDGTGASLLAGGEFFSAGDTEANLVARFDGARWSALGSQIRRAGGFDRIDRFGVFDAGSGPKLFASGSFGITSSPLSVRTATWDGSTWTAVEVSTSREWNEIASFDDGTGERAYLAVTDLTYPPMPAVWRWTGTAWEAVPDCPNNSVEALLVFDDGSGPALFAGGSFAFAGGRIANGIARFDGTSWTNLGSGLELDRLRSGSVHQLAVFDDGSGPALYAAGQFSVAGGVVATNVARWNGSEWSAVGGGLGPAGTSSVLDLEVFANGSSAPVLVAGGDFTQAGGAPANRIAQWDGHEWSPLGSGMDAPVAALATFDSALYAAGRFTTAGGVPSVSVAKWTPATTSSVRRGNVGLGSGAAADVLFVNGSAGDASREVSLGIGEPLELRLDEAPAGSRDGRYVVWAWPGRPSNVVDLAVGGASIGCVANPTPLHAGAPQPIACLAAAGVPRALCGGRHAGSSPARAPWRLQRPAGFGSARVLTVQGVIADEASASPLRFSVTNAVVVEAR
jgi:hypothetical protein